MNNALSAFPAICLFVFSPLWLVEAEGAPILVTNTPVPYKYFTCMVDLFKNVCHFSEPNKGIWERLTINNAPPPPPPQISTLKEIARQCNGRHPLGHRLASHGMSVLDSWFTCLSLLKRFALPLQTLSSELTASTVNSLAISWLDYCGPLDAVSLKTVFESCSWYRMQWPPHLWLMEHSS